MWGSSTDVPNASNSRVGARKLDDTPHRFRIGGHDLESYFSPSDNTTTHIIATINAAQHSVSFEQLTITRSDIATALVNQKNAGRKVRGDMDNNTDSGTQYSFLTSSGVDVKLKSGVSGLLHHKYLLSDADVPQSDAITLTGSHNWSSAAENSNNENTVILHDPDIANQYLQEFSARYDQFGGTDPVTTEVEKLDGLVHELDLAQNFPNPFRGRTHIDYAIPTAQHVRLALYDLQGRRVQTLVDQAQAPGRYRVEMVAKRLGSGVYFYRLEAGKVVRQRKLLMLQ
jgi:phosphatidylserine/phosphatidylglycerophosphate/cardiolipin synthase-like enzyme